MLWLLRRLSHRQRLWIKGGATGASVLSAGYLSLVGLNRVDGIGWLEWICLCIDAGVSIVAGLAATLREARLPGTVRRHIAIRQPLEAAWQTVSQVTGVPFTDLLVSVFFLDGRGEDQRLKRYLRVGVKQIPQSNVRWEKGKGVVGQCWKTEATTRRDLTRLNYTHGSCSEQEWRTLGPEKQMGMSFDDWTKTRRKYDMIVAVPMHDDDEFVGCVALTGPTHNTTWLSAPEVETALVVAATTIAFLRR